MIIFTVHMKKSKACNGLITRTNKTGLQEKFLTEHQHERTDCVHACNSQCNNAAAVQEQKEQKKRH